MTTQRRIVIVGGGVSGLATAYFLRRLGGPDLQITLIEGSDRLGGKVRTREIAGHSVDVGPDAMLVRVPAMASLVEELGLVDGVVTPGHRDAFVWSRARLRRLPPSNLFGVPQKVFQLLRSGLLSPVGVLRAAADLVLPRRRPVPGEDLSVGELLRPRLGSEVFERLVDPLLGGIHAGRADLLSARSAVPEVEALTRSSRSIYLGTRARRVPVQAGPALVGLDGGLTHLIDALTTASDCAVELGRRVDTLSRDGSEYLLRLCGGRIIEADAVVLATPAFVTARLLSGIAPAAAAAAVEVPYADVAVTILAYPRDALPRELDGTGFLVPPSEGLLLVGCSWLSTKWPHLRDPATVLIRAMVGRHGDTRFTELSDDELVERVHGELVLTMGLTGRPVEAIVQRWPKAMPQYTVGHQSLVDRIDASLAEVPRLVVTGAGYRGVGLASCVTQARRTAMDVLDRLGAPQAAGASA
ncbi:MAG: protoporphyrinogen/coproporphyrinogen oxidase [Frankiaceae bacterium]|jgi:oxygen-dependent protoporphyrinogen oxidase|nr:protoporphyrinogen/coproporphyrinogen oxidase [Frankiaceae bacterium]MDQ1714462.1 protoporphyrinogen/coproporphyrinogen oxidase [Frankiaceae bacterium]